MIDKKRLCKGVRPGDGRTHDCLCDKVQQIQDERCKDEMTRRLSRKRKSSGLKARNKSSGERIVHS